jgi:hypothetical protein
MMAMSEDCTKALNALKILLTNPDSYNPYCIGTSETFWKRIKDEGLQPVVCSASGICTDTSYGDVDGRNLNRIWIGRKGNKYCSIYARRAASKSAGKPLNIAFNAHLNPSDMRESKEYIENNGFSPETANLTDISNASSLITKAQSVCSDMEIKRLLDSLPDWSKSLIAQKSANSISMMNINPIQIDNVDETEPLSEIWND